MSTAAGMMRGLRGLAMAAALGLAALAPTDARAQSLADTLVTAYNTSGLLAQNRALLRAADEDVALAVADLRPVIDWIMRARRNFSDSRTGGFTTDSQRTTGFVGLSAQWTLYAGGANRLGVDIAKEAVLATRNSLVSIEQAVLLRAVRAYMNVIRAQETVSLRENNVRVLSQELQAARDRFEVGEVTRTDVALAESRVAEARSNLSLAQGELITSQAEYVTAVGQRPGRIAGLPPLPPRPATLDAAVAVAVRNHPDILEAQHEVAGAELGIKRAAAAFGPSVTANAEMGRTDNYGNRNYNDDVSLTLTYRQPVFAGGALPAQVRKVMASRDARRAALLNTQRDVVQEVSNAYVSRDAARASLAATRERVEAARIAFEGIREEATLGARTTLDVLVAEQDLLDAEAAQINAQTEQYIAAYELLAAQGLLTAQNLGLAVQIYDPTVYYNLAKDAPPTLSKQSRDLNRVLEALGRR